MGQVLAAWGTRWYQDHRRFEVRQVDVMFAFAILTFVLGCCCMRPSAGSVNFVLISFRRSQER